MWRPAPPRRPLLRTTRRSTAREPDLYAAWWYDAVLVFAEGMKKAPALKPENIPKGILSIQKFQGAESDFNFDQNGDGLDHYHVVQNDKDVIKMLKTLHGAR